MYKSRVGLSASVTSYFTLAVRLGGLAPTLSLDFLSGSLDSRITFSRGSNATLVDSTGKVTYAPNNLLTYSAQFDNAAWSKTAATVTADAAVSPDGTTTADKLIESATAGAHNIVQTSTVFNATVYVASAYVKAAERTFVALYAGTVGKGTIFNLSNGTVYGSLVAPPTSSSITPAGNGWYRVSITYTSTSTTSTTAVYLCDETAQFSYTGDGTSGAFIWGAQLEAVTYQTTPSTYNATTASAYYGPRFDYDPVTLNSKGLLIEEQRSNLVTYSEQFDNAAWTKTNATVTANSATAPDGTSTADSLIENTVNGVHDARRSVTASALTTYTQSIFVKASGRTRGQMQMFGNSGGSTINYDLTAGTATAAGAYGGWTGASATITNYGNGWYRITNTATTNAGLTTLVAAYLLADASGSASYTGDGTSGMLYWGAQVEAGAFATSYIPTVASTVTRSADVASMTGTNFSSWYNQSEGTVFVSYDIIAYSANQRIFSINDGTVSNEAAEYSSTGSNRMIVTSGGVTVATPIGLSPISAGVIYNAALAFKLDDFAISVNGNSPVTDTSGAMPVSVTKLGIGSNSVGTTTYLNGHIRRIAYYPTRLANATLQRLTA